MKEATKVFISYSTRDRELAKRLHDDLSGRGAQVFQFEETARAGSEVWRQVVQKIKEADWFVVLLSENALESRPVRKEIGYALNFNINREQPNLVPVRLDSSSLPDELSIFTELGFADYESMLESMGELLGLGQASEATATSGRIAEGHATGAELHVSLRAEPEECDTETSVHWRAEVRNSGDVALDDLSAHLGKQKLAQRLTLQPGEVARFSRQVRYAATGRKERQLTVKCLREGGPIVSYTAVATVKVLPAKKRKEATGTAPTPLARKAPLLSEALRSARVDLGGASNKILGVGASSSDLIPALSAALFVHVGLAVAVSLFWGSFHEWLVAMDWIAALEERLASFTGDATWPLWGSAAVGGCLIVGFALIIAEHIVLVDAVDYAWSALWSGLASLVLAEAWVLLFQSSYTWQVGALWIALGVSWGVLSVLAFLEEA